MPRAGTLGCKVWPGAETAHSPGVCPSFYLPQMNVGPPCPPAITTASLPLLHHCHTMSSLPQLPSSAPPIHLDEYFFFKSLVVRLPYSLVFWHLWSFLVLKLVMIPLTVVRGGKVCVPIPPSWPEVHNVLIFKNFGILLNCFSLHYAFLNGLYYVCFPNCSSIF